MEQEKEIKRMQADLEKQKMEAEMKN